MPTVGEGTESKTGTPSDTKQLQQQHQHYHQQKMSMMLNNLPSLCFDRDAFFVSGSESINIDSFIASCRQRVSLETLMGDLNIFLKSLHSELIELINRDYADFVNLSSNLVGLDKTIADLRAPLVQVKEEVLAVRSTVDDVLGSLKVKLDERALTREKKATLKLFLNISTSLGKIEKLMDSYHTSKLGKETTTTHSAAANSSSSSVVSQSQSEDVSTSNATTNIAEQDHLRLLERIASEYNQLQFFVSQGSDLPFVKNIHQRVSFISSKLLSSLEENLMAALESKDNAHICQCFRTYVLTDKVFEGEMVYRQKVVAPLLKQLMTPAKLNSVSGLEGIFKSILEVLDTQVVPVSSLLSNSGVKAFDLVVNSMFPELINQLITGLPSIFVSAIPGNFHKNFTTTQKFLRDYEYRCKSKLSVTKLRDHESYKKLMDKWSFHVYFQLRMHEVGSELEATILSQPLKVTTIKQFTLAISSSFWSALQTTWSDTIYIDAICHRFWKLTLHLISRYISWIKHTVDATTQSLKKHVSEASATSNSSSMSTTALVANASSAKTHETNIQQLVLISTDISELMIQLPIFYTKLCQEKLKICLDAMSEEQKSGFTASFTENLEALQKIQSDINSNLISSVVDLMILGLNSLKSVKSMYRMTNKEMPTKPSHNAPSVKLLQILSPMANPQLKKALSSLWINAVLDSVCSKIIDTCAEEIATVKKTEDSLNRLKNLRQSSAVPVQPSESQSDAEKIQRQFQLDILHFVEQVTSIDTDLQSNTSLSNVKAWADEPLKL